MDKLTSFVHCPKDSHFPIQNIPFGIFRPSPDKSPRIGVAIGEMVVDMSVLADSGVLGDDFPPDITSSLKKPSLNSFMSLGKQSWRQARLTIQSLLSAENPLLRDDVALQSKCFHRQKDVTMDLPAAIGDFTDFYASEYHASNVGTIFRGKENALPVNWKHIPIGYHGRSSSIVVSGTKIQRPVGQMSPPQGSTSPEFRMSRVVDFELEMGAFIGPGNLLGEPISIEDSLDHVFGLVLLNDWSARDIQKWEYVPLGPFLGKNFATSISPWVVTMDALSPFLCEAPIQDPAPLSYLREDQRLTFDIKLEASIKAEGEQRPSTVCQTNFSNLYWTLGQQVAHHTVNGCNLRPGDLLGSGTISGDSDASMGSLLELSWGGTKDVPLCNGGGVRRYLEDGDEVIFTGFCQSTGHGGDIMVGFGDCRGIIVPGRSK